MWIGQNRRSSVRNPTRGRGAPDPGPVPGRGPSSGRAPLGVGLGFRQLGGQVGGGARAAVGSGLDVKRCKPVPSRDLVLSDTLPRPTALSFPHHPLRTFPRPCESASARDWPYF